MPLFGLLAPPDSRFSPSPGEVSHNPSETSPEAGGVSLSPDRELSRELRSREMAPEVNLGQISAMAAAAARGWPVCLETVLVSLVDAGLRMVAPPTLLYTVTSLHITTTRLITTNTTPTVTCFYRPAHAPPPPLRMFLLCTVTSPLVPLTANTASTLVPLTPTAAAHSFCHIPY